MSTRLCRTITSKAAYRKKDVVMKTTPMAAIGYLSRRTSSIGMPL